jgi:putative cell wall-binding protein
VASGTSFADALAGASFAAARGGPILLVRRDALPNATAGELDRLNPKVVTVLGGTSAVSDEIAEAVAEYASVEAHRVSGPDRWATAANISSGFVAPVDTVYVASGLDYPDALTGGAAIGGTTGGPLLLVLPNEVPSATAAELTRLKPTNIVVLGGTSAISDAVVTALAPYATNTPIRRSGADRYETALQVANAFASAPVVYLSRGDAFADALAAGASAGFRRGPILLVPHDCIPFDVDLAIQRLGATEVIVLGGTAALSDEVLAGTPC